MVILSFLSTSTSILPIFPSFPVPAVKQSVRFLPGQPFRIRSRVAAPVSGFASGHDCLSAWHPQHPFRDHHHALHHLALHRNHCDSARVETVRKLFSCTSNSSSETVRAPVARRRALNLKMLENGAITCGTRSDNGLGRPGDRQSVSGHM